MYFPWEFVNRGSEPLYYNPLLRSFDSNYASQVMRLIETPRQLMAVERETREKWNGGLKGEIYWYDLLLMSVLKASEPHVFEWIMREQNLFMEEGIGFKKPTEKEKNTAAADTKEQLKGLLSVPTKSRLELVTQVLIDLFPKFGKRYEGLAEFVCRQEPQVWEQRISTDARNGSSYLKCYFFGGVPSGEVADQPTLQYIRNIIDNGFEQKEFERRYLDSIKKLTNDCNRFVYFSKLLPIKLTRDVCDCMLDWMCDREHWSVWEQEEEYVSDVMGDIRQILSNAGEYEYVQARKKSLSAISETNATEGLEIWLKDKLKKLVVKDIVVAIGLGVIFFDRRMVEIEVKPLLGRILKEEFLNNKEAIWGKVKGWRTFLRNVLEVLKYNDDYESIRDLITSSVVERAGDDKSGEFKTSIVMSLVHYSYPAGNPDLVEGYKFSVKKAENQETYNMEMILPLIVGWEGQKFEDPVSAKAYEFLLKEYAEELQKMDEPIMEEKKKAKEKEQPSVQDQGG